ncbi:MAG TPA: DUF6526 family protein [Thermoanaerobaculia bacterium]|jgi:hypothetical protein|nr:DUF6526 family protein [Thermoanaerobaculia bacterium]
MAQEKPQSFANHRRIVPLYHVGVFGILAINFIWRTIAVIRVFSWTALLDNFVAVALLGIFFYTRIFALTVQDRVIRLEMRLRLREILPADLKGRIEELSPGQLVALRFAGDAEMADLIREVLTNNLHNRDEIKRRVKDWKADDLRC